MSGIRPMSFGEILDGSLTLYRRNFGVFLRLAIASLIVPVLLIAYFMIFMVNQLMMAVMMMMIDPVLIAMIVLIVVTYIVGTLMMTAGTIRVISDSYLNRPTTFGQAIGLGVSKIWPLFIVGIAKGILLALLGIVVGGVLAVGGPMMAGSGAVGVVVLVVLAILGVWFCIWVAAGYGVTTPVVVLETLGGSFEAFGRSWGLTRGSRGKVVGLFIVATLLFSVVPQFILQFIAGAVMTGSPGAGMAILFASYLLPIVLYPAISCVVTLMYYDLRVRREAFDLQMLSQQLGG
jgi:hypothetical protein